MIYRFGDRLVPVTVEEWDADQSPAVFVTDSRHADAILAKAGIIYENEIQVSKIGFCRTANVSKGAFSRWTALSTTKWIPP